MNLVAPVFEGTFDRNDPAGPERFKQQFEEFKAKIPTLSVTKGHLIHRWLDSDRLHVLVFADDLEGRGEAQRLIDAGYEALAYEGRPAAPPELSDLVTKVKLRVDMGLDQPS